MLGFENVLDYLPLEAERGVRHRRKNGGDEGREIRVVAAFVRAVFDIGPFVVCF